MKCPVTFFLPVILSPSLFSIVSRLFFFSHLCGKFATLTFVPSSPLKLSQFLLCCIKHNTCVYPRKMFFRDNPCVFALYCTMEIKPVNLFLFTQISYLLSLKVSLSLCKPGVFCTKPMPLANTQEKIGLASSGCLPLHRQPLHRLYNYKHDLHLYLIWG